jgi:retron-type reverse transcriptase
MSGIFEKIISAENLFSAWREFRRGKRGKPGVPEFERHIEDNVFALSDELASGRYRHGPYKRFLVRDPKLRVIHKATVRDRLVHHAIHRVLYPVLDRSFIHDSYSCRVGKGTHAAVRRFEVFARKVSKNYHSPCWVLKFDVKRFFDSVDHGILLENLKSRIDCPETTRLFQEIVGSFAIAKYPPPSTAYRSVI